MPDDANPDASTSGPLSRLRVLDLSRLQPGAFCTLLLADLGADVLRIEQPGAGDPLRMIPGGHVAYNHGKRSMTLDVKHARAAEILERLARGADVVIESSRPGTMDRNGMGYPDLAVNNPGLIWCSITGFGQESPYGARAGHDITFLGHSGLLALMAGDADPPKTVPPTPDFVLAVPFGALMAAVGILAAVAERAHTGKGRRIDTSIVDSATWILSEHVARVAGGQPAGWGEAASRRAYRCADGRLITIAAAEPRTWAALCEALQTPDLADRLNDPPAGQAEVTARLEQVFVARPAAEWLDVLGDVGAGIGAVNRVEDLFDDPHLRARGAIVSVPGDPDGARIFENPLRLFGLDGARTRVAPRPAPGLGEHTDTALAAAGFSEDEIAALHADGAV